MKASTLMLASALCLVAAPSLLWAAPQSVQVKLRESKVRSQPKFWASGVADVRYGDTLTVMGSEESWFRVKTRSGAQGFVHPSVVTEKQIVLTSKGSVNTTADRSDVVLAGKGFSKDIENAYASTNPTANFRAVDQVERTKIGSQELISFMREGKLGKGRL